MIILATSASLGSGHHPGPEIQIQIQIMTVTTTIIRIDIDTLPEHVDRSRPNFVAKAIEAALRQDGIEANCSDLFSYLKIDLPAAQLAAASTVLVDLKFI